MSVLKIYNSKLSRDRNARIDEIQSYLTSLTPVYETDAFQYIKLDLNLSIKLVLDQNKVGSAVGNYVDLYQDEKHFYFFINRANWKSTSTVELVLKLDTVNTFADDFTFNKKTTIHRQHKNRGYRKNVRSSSQPNSFVNFLNDYEYELLPTTSGSPSVYYYDYFESSHEDMNFVCYDEQNNIVATHPGGAYFGFKEDTFFILDDHEYEIFSITLDEIEEDNSNGLHWYVYATKPFDYSDPDSMPFSTLLPYRRHNYGNKFIYSIDRFSEGINPNLFYNPNLFTETIYERGGRDLRWYLWFQSITNDANSAVGCWLYPSEEITAFVLDPSESNDIYIQPSDLDSGKYYYLMPKKLGTNLITGGNNQPNGYDVDVNYEATLVGNVHQFTQPLIRNFKSGQFVKAEASRFTKIWKTLDNYISIEEYWINDIAGVQHVNHINRGKVARLYLKGLHTTDLPCAVSTTSTDNPKTIATFQPHAFDFTGQLDLVEKTIPALPKERTDPRIIKVIELPYCPVNFQIDPEEGKYEFVSKEFVYDNASQSPIGAGDEYNTLKLKDIDSVFGQTFEVDDTVATTCSTTLPTTIYLTDARNDNLESKIRHSEFFQPVWMYDNNTFVVRPESLNIQEGGILGATLTVDFKPSNNLNSYMLFRFDYDIQYSDIPYENYMVCNRNNEKPIYNSEYLNYLKNGYRYDVKNKETNIGRGVAQTALSVGAGIASGALVGSTAGPVGIAIGAAVGLASGIISTIATQVQSENSIQQKLDQTSNQKTSIQSSDDLCMLNIYNGNKLLYREKECSQQVKDLLLDLFFYTGYADNVQQVPDLNSRMWFNYIQCDAVFNEEAGTPYREYLEDLKARYAEGVTVYHRNEGSGYIYDWTQQFENYERELFTPIN